MDFFLSFCKFCSIIPLENNGCKNWQKKSFLVLLDILGLFCYFLIKISSFLKHLLYGEIKINIFSYIFVLRKNSLFIWRNLHKYSFAFFYISLILQITTHFYFFTFLYFFNFLLAILNIEQTKYFITLLSINWEFFIYFIIFRSVRLIGMI